MTRLSTNSSSPTLDIVYSYYDFIYYCYHPDKQQLLIYDLFYNNRYSPNDNDNDDYISKMMSSNPENYLVPLQFYHEEILKIAEGIYDNLLKVAVNNAIYPASATQCL